MFSRSSSDAHCAEAFCFSRVMNGMGDYSVELPESDFSRGCFLSAATGDDVGVGVGGSSMASSSLTVAKE